MSNSKTTWFIEPRNAATNETTMEDLARVCGATSDKIYYDKFDNKGKSHNVVEAPSHNLITRVKASVPSFNLKFRVFRQKGDSGEMEECDLDTIKKQARARRTMANIRVGFKK